MVDGSIDLVALSFVLTAGILQSDKESWLPCIQVNAEDCWLCLCLGDQGDFFATRADRASTDVLELMSVAGGTSDAIVIGHDIAVDVKRHQVGVVTAWSEIT